MDSIMEQALEIVKAQATTRSMTAEEITSMLTTLTKSFTDLASGVTQNAEAEQVVDQAEAKKAIREKSVVCMECEKSFKVLTRRHLAMHGLTPDEYREKWGYKKGTSLVAKSLARDRRKKMQEMELWKKRIKPERAPSIVPADARNPAQAEIE